MTLFVINNFLGKLLNKGIGAYVNFNEFPNHKDGWEILIGFRQQEEMPFQWRCGFRPE